MKTLFKLLAINLNLFDGAAAAAGEGSGVAAANPGESNIPSSVTGKRSKQGVGQVIKYGIQDVQPEVPAAQAANEQTKPSTITTSDTLEARKADFEKFNHRSTKIYLRNGYRALLTNASKKLKFLKQKTNRFNRSLKS